MGASKGESGAAVLSAGLRQPRPRANPILRRTGAADSVCEFAAAPPCWFEAGAAARLRLGARR